MKTRNKENLFIDLCINTGQKFVIDNTNATKELRKDYISKIKTKKYKIIGYYFESKINDCINRNNLRDGKEKIPEKGILGIYNKLELPSLDEGFDELYYVSIINSKFHIKEWNNEI
ncbi:MAG: ATP-binding protein [Candidatus Sericytochromatia bacterium]